ncbi:MAG: AmmeMemoRadiSam system protein A [Deltaproteobacteria bacterium]|jgi:AmmeMemoRadiSam system protein A|nr:AmmeMemoRadiSam system protein A [Deltaproteobacteria bacterium]
MDTSQTIGFSLTEDERANLARLACLAIENGLAGQARPDAAPPEPKEAALRAPAGAFVTLHSQGRLRGCIGSIMPREPLYMTVSQMAHAAAFQDPRFPPLQPAEWPSVSLEISVLSPLTPCPDPELITVGRHGLVLAWRGRSGVFLPQVPVEQHWSRLQYLDALCGKAGLPPGSWKQPGAELFWFEALVFPVSRK